MTTVYDFEAKTITGKTQKLEDFRGKWLLVVNVASKCGFTPQYKGLEALYELHRIHGLEIAAFPCDQFGHQEPGTEAEIQSFCATTYGVTFPMFAKIKVNGDDAHPLYKWLKSQEKGFLGTEFIKWNFTKFLVNPEGEVVKRFAPNETPETIEKDLQSRISAT